MYVWGLTGYRSVPRYITGPKTCPSQRCPHLAVPHGDTDVPRPCVPPLRDAMSCTSTHTPVCPHVLPALADELDDAVLHGDGVEAAVGGAGSHLVQQPLHHPLVSGEAPEVELQVMAVHLHLLQPEAPQCPQPHTLQQRL